MLKIQLFNLGIGEVVMRFYLMMSIAFLFGFMQQWILMVVFAGPIAASALLGMRFNLNTPQEAKRVGKIIHLELKKEIKKAS